MDAETMTMLTGLLGVVLAFVLIGAALGGAWLLGRGWHRRGDVFAERSSEALNAQRIDLLMARIDELSLTVERSAEAQRYVAKVLASGARFEPLAGAADPMRPQEKVITPH